MSLGDELVKRMQRDGLIDIPEQTLEKEQKKKEREEQIKKERTKIDEQQEQDNIAQIALDLVKNTGFSNNARAFLKVQPIYYDRNNIWWLWNKEQYRWEITDETDIITINKQAFKLFGDSNIKHKNFMLEAIKQEARLNKPLDFPKHWIQFKERIYDLQTGDTYLATHDYFCVNPIPWSIGTDEDTPNISKLFDEWVGAEYTQTLYEIIAYMCYADYPIHIIICLVGTGRNGKSKFLGLIQRFIGKENLASTELEQLFENRFETFKLYRKLGCLMGETNFNTIRNTSLLKRLTGQDLIGYEAKGKMPFDDYNYAKIIISTNALPTSDDTSDGFYRRWMIINFPNEFPEGRDILNDIPEQEYRNLAKKITRILPKLLERGKFLTQGSIEERKKRYIETSNPLLIFIKEFCVKDENTNVKYSTLYTRYAHWLSESKRRVVTRREFSQMLEKEGHEIQRTSMKNEMGIYENGIWVLGLKFKEKISEFVNDVNDVNDVSISSYNIEANSNLGHIVHNDNIAPINEVYTGNQGFQITKATDILEFLRGHAPAPVSYTTLLTHISPELPNPEQWLSTRLAAMSANGDVFSPQPDMWTVLQ